VWILLRYVILTMMRIIKNNLCNLLVICLVFLTVTGWIFSGWPRIWQDPSVPPQVKEVKAIEYLSNPSFTDGTTDWTLSIATYDSTTFQDTAGSIKTISDVGRNKTAKGTCDQTITTSIGSSDTVLLSLYWKKGYTSSVDAQDLKAQIAKPSDPATFIDIWSDVQTGNIDWTSVGPIDVSSYFDETGTYIFRYYMYMDNPNDANAQAWVWIDNTSFDVTATAIVSVSVSDGIVAYGTLGQNSTKGTHSGDLNDLQTATNDGNVTEDFNIKGQNSTNWTLGATAATDVYVHQFCTSTCTTPPTNYTALTTSYATLATGIAASGNQTFDLYINTPNTSSVFTQQSVDVIIQAVQSP